MYELKSNEKSTDVIIYTADSLIYGQVVTRDIVPVHILLRTEGAPTYLHLLNAKIIRPANASKITKLPELFFPVAEAVGFHVAPNVEASVDYDEGEENRRMFPVKVIMGIFFLDSKIRISTKTELDTTLEVSRATWLSLYDVRVSCSYLAQMNVFSSMILVRPEKTAFGLTE